MKSQTIVLKDQALSSQIFASRAGIVTVTPVEDCVEMEAVVVSPTLKFVEARDYVVRVVNKGGRLEVQHIAGKAPRWANFPEQWAAWVQNQDVRTSAFGYITARVPAAASPLTVATRKTGKQKLIEAWGEVARACGLDEAKIKGSGTWTAVHAMPVRIAQALSGKAPRAERWEPAVPRPIYEDAEKSGRVLVASPKGA